MGPSSRGRSNRGNPSEMWKLNTATKRENVLLLAWVPLLACVFIKRNIVPTVPHTVWNWVSEYNYHKHNEKIRATRRRVLYKWKQTCGNGLLVIFTLDKKGQRRRRHTAKYSVTQFSNFRIAIDLDIYNGRRELVGKHLNISLKGSIMTWRIVTNGTLSRKTIFRWQARLWRVSWRFRYPCIWLWSYLRTAVPVVVTLERTFAAVGKRMFGQGATPSTTVLEVVTLEKTFAIVRRSWFQSLTFKK